MSIVVSKLQIALGLLWTGSGVGKIISIKSIDFSKIIDQFASGNPLLFYKSFLNLCVLPNTNIFMALVILGEIMGGIILLITGIIILKKQKTTKYKSLALVSLPVLIFMNTNFLLAAGWANIGILIINIALIIFQIILFRLWQKNKPNKNP